MEETRVTTFALWGLGDLSPENATALLNEYIPDPDDVGAVYRPDRVGREHQGLRTALAWFESPDFGGPDSATPTTDIVGSLIDDRNNHGDEVYLLALWPEVPQHEDFDFIEAVQNEGITVLDLSRAMDELDLSLYERPAPTPEEKKAARDAARAEKAAAKEAAPKRSRKKLSDDAGDPSDTDTVVTVGVTRPNVPVFDLIEEEARLWLAVEVAKAELDRAIKAYTETVTVSMIPVREDIEAREDTPPFEETPHVPTTAYFWSAVGGYRLANGKPRRGEEVRNLTLAEEKELGLK